MAKPFHFKLQRILEYRKQVEDQAKLALAQAKHAAEAQARLLDQLEEDLRGCLDAMTSGKNMTQADLWLWTGYKKRLEFDTQEARRKFVELNQHAEKLRRELVARSTERKLLEKFRAKQAEKHVQAEQHKEQKEFDETATLRYGRAPY